MARTQAARHGSDAGQGSEHYELSWPGKEAARCAAEGPSAMRRTIVAERSVGGAEPPHLIIEGDNLDALKLLRDERAGAIDLAYVDPPYNTGKQFTYGDRFEGRHGWLAMMYPRLSLARELLAEHGCLFVSIDDRELFHLRFLLNELYGEENFLGTIVWQTATDNNASQIATEHEYVVAYARDARRQGRWARPSEKARAIQTAYEELKARHGDDTAAIGRALSAWIRAAKRRGRPDLSGVEHYRFVDERGVFYPGNPADTRPGRYVYEIPHPATGRPCARPENGYRWPAATFRAAAERGDVLWGRDERVIPKIKKRLETASELLRSTYYEDNRRATRALAELMGGRVFDNPKSVGLIQRILRFAAGPDATVLDFFAGSGTTAEAVLRLNAEDGGRRRFVLVQNAEPVPEGSAAAALGHATIADVAAERVRRVLRSLGERSVAEGFRYERLIPAAREPAG